MRITSPSPARSARGSDIEGVLSALQPSQHLVLAAMCDARVEDGNGDESEMQAKGDGHEVEGEPAQYRPGKPPLGYQRQEGYEHQDADDQRCIFDSDPSEAARDGVDLLDRIELEVLGSPGGVQADDVRQALRVGHCASPRSALHAWKKDVTITRSWGIRSKRTQVQP